MTQLSNTLRMIDAINNEDPNPLITPNGPISKEVIYSQRMQNRLSLFLPKASEILHIAAYSQHVKRWAIPRSDYPMNKTGYKKWRTALGTFHAETTAQVMKENDYDDTAQERVKYLLQKKGLKKDPETQALEDIICLVFLEFYLEDFSTKHNEEKLIGIIQKTWNKMSDTGRATALTLPIPAALFTLIKKALNL